MTFQKSISCTWFCAARGAWIEYAVNTHRPFDAGRWSTKFSWMAVGVSKPNSKPCKRAIKRTGVLFQRWQNIEHLSTQNDDGWPVFESLEMLSRMTCPSRPTRWKRLLIMDAVRWGFCLYWKIPNIGVNMPVCANGLQEHCDTSAPSLLLYPSSYEKGL